MVITEKTVHAQGTSTIAPGSVPPVASAQGIPLPGLDIPRRFSRPTIDPLDEIEYEYRRSVITEPDGTVVFAMDKVEVPKTWSQLATDIIVSKYFRKAGVPGETGTETSARQVVYRIAHTIREQGEQRGYFNTPEDANAFEAELSHLMITQKGAFNSPVWFNCGLHQYGIEGSGGNWYYDDAQQKVVEAVSSYEHPQCSACFIQSVEDDLMSLFDLAKNEARLFKFGSGTGTNFSKIRGRQEKLSGGGTSSGLMSFLEVLDRGAGATKSGGTTRRAAKMVSLDMDHPEIVDFINWKQKEEKKVKVLIDAGYPSDFNGEAYHTVAGQNSNNSVRLSDSFMQAVLQDGDWQTTFRTTGEVCETFKAKDLMTQISQAAWACADPGVQFDDIINDWHTCLGTDRIYGSNPCSEYHFLNDTACNLASINLMLFHDERTGKFDVEGFRHACRIFFIAQEILVGFASYPTERIAKNSYDYRPLGLGYANLGAYLMVNGIPYDSEESFAIAGAITAMMCGQAYATSAEIAAVQGPFAGYADNRASMLHVMGKHREKAYEIAEQHCPKYLIDAAREDWDQALALGQQYGYRNAQATVLAPTGTIGLLMDCDTTGIEPDFALVKWKKLAGGGYFKIVNQALPKALRNLGYTGAQIDGIITYILGHGTLDGAPGFIPEQLELLGFTADQIEAAQTSVAESHSFNEWTPGVTPKLLKEKGWSKEQMRAIDVYVNGAQTVEGAPFLRDEHLPVFDCANRCGVGERFIAPMAHIRIMAATQPFLSGAISKTVNLPNDATVEDIERIYLDSWRLGLKCVALYRDGCKLSQPLNVKARDEDDEEVTAPDLQPTMVPVGLQRGDRRELPRKREGVTIDANVAGTKMYLRTGEYEDGQLGEIFIDTFKEGASYRSLLNCFAVAVSLGLQYGVPLERFVNQFTFTRFEPCGMTDHPNVKNCTSVLDYIFRVIGMEYLAETDAVQVKPDMKSLRVNTQAAAIDRVTAAADALQQSILPIVPESVHATHGNSHANAGNGSHSAAELSNHLKDMMGDAPPCDNCGNITVRNGSCYRCLSCGSSMGCS